MNINIPCRHTAEIGRLFASIGEPVRFVGGCVRDTIKGIGVKDIDLASPARPEVVLEAAEAAGYRVIPTGLQHGTVTVVIEDEGYEITTLRADVETDGRHATVAYVRDFETDAARRDFTFNAMSADLDGTVHDYFGGQRDLFHSRVIFVGNLDDRITEDYLRILRFYRFRARYGGMEPDGYVEAIGKHVNGLHRISGERIWSELSRILVSERARKSVADMERTGVLATSGLNIMEKAGSTALALAQNGFADGKAALILGLVTKDAMSLAVAADRWRMSTSDRELARLALGIRQTIAEENARGSSNMYDEYFWINRAIEGESLEDTRVVLNVLGYQAVADHLPTELPIFPVKGQDLLDRGMKPGKEVGLKLRELKDAWKASRYTLDAEELLSHGVAPVSEGPRR
ncbi:CCA tRNA nucleotidyltransferase [Sinorhizobium meliloti]|nr:CCA tRNA nucleotidyltransferase [Sinorhizobium meliloti]